MDPDSQTAIEGQKAGKGEPGETAFSPRETKPPSGETTKPESERDRKSAGEPEKTANLKPTDLDPTYDAARDVTGAYGRYLLKTARRAAQPPPRSGENPDNAVDVVEEIGRLAFIRTYAGNIPGGRKLSVKVKACELLMRYHGLIVERTQRVPADVREARELLLEEAKRAGLRIEPGPRPALLTTGETTTSLPSRK